MRAIAGLRFAKRRAALALQRIAPTMNQDHEMPCPDCDRPDGARARPLAAPRRDGRALACALLACSGLALHLQTASAQAAPTPTALSSTVSSDAAAPPPLLDAMQLDQMLAPIALYPDELLGPILMAATYPLEIVEADRWLQDPANGALRGGPLAQAMQRQPWDASVKTLVAFPQVLSALDNNLDWTAAVGDAFVAQQDLVMDRIQQLRARAEAARTLVSSPQQVVRDVGPDIEIHSPASGMVYVPEYDPNLVFGSWPYVDNPPADFELPDYVAGGFIGFVVLVPYWGWSSWDWHRHRIGAVAPGSALPTGSTTVPRWRPDPRRRRAASGGVGGAVGHGARERGAQARAIPADRRAAPAGRTLPGAAPRPVAMPPGVAAPAPDGAAAAGAGTSRLEAARPRQQLPAPGAVHGVAENPPARPMRESPVRPEPELVRPPPRQPARPAEAGEGERPEGGRERR